MGAQGLGQTRLSFPLGAWTRPAPTSSLEHTHPSDEPQSPHADLPTPQSRSPGTHLSMPQAPCGWSCTGLVQCPPWLAGPPAQDCKTKRLVEEAGGPLCQMANDCSWCLPGGHLIPPLSLPCAVEAPLLPPSLPDSTGAQPGRPSGAWGREGRALVGSPSLRPVSQARSPQHACFLLGRRGAHPPWLWGSHSAPQKGLQPHRGRPAWRASSPGG